VEIVNKNKESGLDSWFSQGIFGSFKKKKIVVKERLNKEGKGGRQTTKQEANNFYVIALRPLYLFLFFLPI
jgi:hypothetical protein